MMFYFDAYGFYTSTPTAGRSTDTAPVNTSETTTPGELRANWTGNAWVELPFFAPPPPPPANRNTLTAEIDAAVAAITARCAPFLEEYKTREAQARAFAAANFTGTVPQQVAAFATPAGLSAQVATQTIIGQADALRTASDLLGVQRMRKYEVLRAATDAEARTAHADVMATIAAIGAQIG